VLWRSYDGRTLTISRTRTKKSAARTRTIVLNAVTARELKEWRLICGRPGDDEPIIGCEMTEEALKQWGTRRLRPAIKQVTRGRITNATTYTLRHSHASALHHTMMTMPTILKRMGHGWQAHHKHYAHIIDGLEGVERYADLDALYAAALQRTSAHSERTRDALR
jgi:integrase